MLIVSHVFGGTHLSDTQLSFLEKATAIAVRSAETRIDLNNPSKSVSS